MQQIILFLLLLLCFFIHQVCCMIYVGIINVVYLTMLLFGILSLL